MTDARPSVEDRARRRLRALRTERGWSLDELARRSGVNPSTISRIETGGRPTRTSSSAPSATRTTT